MGQVLCEFQDTKKESPRGPINIGQKEMQSPRGPQLNIPTNMHKQKGPLRQMLCKFQAPKKKSPRGPAHLAPKIM